MTSKVTIHAESHDCEVRQLPVVLGQELPWESLSEETRRFQVHIVPVGKSRDFHVHGGMSLLVRERVNADIAAFHAKPHALRDNGK